MRMQRINYRAGDIVIKQGTEGDYSTSWWRGNAS